MILETYATFAGEILEGVLELVCGTVGVLARNVPMIEIHGEGLAAVDVAGDARGPSHKRRKAFHSPTGLEKSLVGASAVVEGSV